MPLHSQRVATVFWEAIMNARVKVLAAASVVLLACPSANGQHLTWNLEGQRDATCLYGTITVLATHPAIYYCGANWHPGEPAGGYCGIQDNSEQQRRTIFSIWDTARGLNPRVTEADPYTRFGRFGGEGEGGHTHMVLPWKTGETFQFFVQKHPGKMRGTTDTRYYFCEGNQRQWRHAATITNPNGGYRSVLTIGGGLNSFLENFAGKEKDIPKVALYRLWLGSSVDTLWPLRRAEGDGIWGQLHDSYFLAEGAPEKLERVFLELERNYGRPFFGGRGIALWPLSNRGVPAEVTRALKRLPRAEVVQDNSDSPHDGKAYIIRSFLTRKRLAIEKGSKAEGAKVVQDASSATHVVWKLEQVGDSFRIINTTSGLVLEAVGANSPLQQRRASQGSSQAWYFVKAGDAYHIKCKQNGLVLDVSGGSTDDGAAIIPYALKDTPAPNQLWMLTEVKR
jgi:Domain of unknown function (DUF3472)/Ricin-type beta-trefoil lectin domain-like